MCAGWCRGLLQPSASLSIPSWFPGEGGSPGNTLKTTPLAWSFPGKKGQKGPPLFGTLSCCLPGWARWCVTRLKGNRWGGLWPVSRSSKNKTLRNHITPGTWAAYLPRHPGSGSTQIAPSPPLSLSRACQVACFLLLPHFKHLASASNN